PLPFPLAMKEKLVLLLWKCRRATQELQFCKQCLAEISRGGSSAKTFGTTALINHLKAKHPEQHAQFERATAAVASKRKAPSSTHTQSVAAVFEKTKKFGRTERGERVQRQKESAPRRQYVCPHSLTCLKRSSRKTTQMPGRQRVPLLNSWTLTCQKSPSPGVTIL
ncbi:unnamed protein product, partial [Pleuronectes platessa]